MCMGVRQIDTIIVVTEQRIYQVLVLSDMWAFMTYAQT